MRTRDRSWRSLPTRGWPATTAAIRPDQFRREGRAGTERRRTRGFPPRRRQPPPAAPSRRGEAWLRPAALFVLSPGRWLRTGGDAGNIRILGAFAPRTHGAFRLGRGTAFVFMLALFLASALLRALFESGSGAVCHVRPPQASCYVPSSALRESDRLERRSGRDDNLLATASECRLAAAAEDDAPRRR